MDEMPFEPAGLCACTGAMIQLERRVRDGAEGLFVFPFQYA